MGWRGHNIKEGTETISKNEDSNLNNHWLAGFSDADASFQIKLINKNQRSEVRLNYQKENTLLKTF